MNQNKNYLTTAEEPGFTLVEVIVAVAILSFAIFATLRVITASLNSITRQGQRVKALHLAQAHLAKLEAESFPKVVPEIWTIDSGGTPPPTYQLNIYDSNVSASQILVSSDDDYWYDDGNPDTEDLGFDDTGQVKSDGILVADKDGTTYTVTSTSPPPSENYNWDSTTLTLTFSAGDVGKEIQIYYRYYHLVNEGGTIPSSDGEGIKEGIIRITTDAGTLTNITVEEMDKGKNIKPDSYSSTTRELAFKKKDEEKSVWIYYLPQKTTDSDGDGYENPTDDSILGVVGASFCNPDGSLANQITNIKKVTVTEYWKQGEELQSTKQETYVTN
ncbi:MAG: prepilin-type N-terminal cleavage/methylation domain-containing protein [bacterium]